MSGQQFADRVTRLFSPKPALEPSYRLERPDIFEDTQGVRNWLFRHPDGGWLQTPDMERMQCSRRLLFILDQVRKGRISDHPVPESLIARAVAIPSEMRREKAER